MQRRFGFVLKPRLVAYFLVEIASFFLFPGQGDILASALTSFLSTHQADEMTAACSEQLPLLFCVLSACCELSEQGRYAVCNGHSYGLPFVKILYLTDLSQKLLSLLIFSYLCAHLAISACV